VKVFDNWTTSPQAEAGLRDRDRFGPRVAELG
jgi:hypothetical protein